MSNLIVSTIIAAIIALAIWKIFKEKQKGNKCIGCAVTGKCDSSKQNKKSAFLARQIDIKEVK